MLSRILILPTLAWLLTTCLPVWGQAVRSNAGFRSSALPRNDDGSSGAVPLGFTINFYGVSHSTTYVNNNGNISFGGAIENYTPEALTALRRQIIAPFWADVDTLGARSDVVRYGPDTVDGRRAFGVNYVNVGYFDGRDDKLNSFQVILIDRSDTGPGNFDIEFNYDRIVWETGSANGGANGLGGVSASAGWSNGSGQPSTSFQIEGSRTPGALLDSNPNGLIRRRLNSLVNGRLVFQARSGSVSLFSISSLDPSSVQAGTSAFTLTVNGNGFLPGAAVRWNTTTLQTTVVGSNQVRASVPAALVAAVGTANVTVVNSNGAVAGPVPFQVTAGTPPPSTPGISVSLTNPSSPLDAPSISIRLSSPAQVEYRGVLSASFTVDAAANAPAGYVDPAMQFAGGGRTVAFTIPVGATSASLSSAPNVQTGTVAGVITISVSELRSQPGNALVPLDPLPRTSIAIPRTAPVVSAGSVRITDVTADRFVVELSGYSTSRQLTSASFTFTAAGGARLDGPTVFQSQLNGAVIWFDSVEGRSNGSRFGLRVPFLFSGDASAISSVSVTLSNPLGASAAVVGGR